MAAAATARKAAAAPARAPQRKKRPALAVAPARKPPARKVPARKPAPARRKAPARRPGGQLIPIAVGTATAVRNLPDSGLVVRLTRGRAWIGVLGVLLVGIVALNVVTLSLAASAGQIDQNVQALDEENSYLRSRDAQKSGAGRIRHEAAALGLSAAAVDQVTSVQLDPADVETAARRLAAAGSVY
jgi:hypothetical protein